MKLFDYINVIFSANNAKWEEVSELDMARNAFMLNRLMSIKFPIQAQMLNIMKISPVGQAQTWRNIAKQFKRTPGFIYTKTKNMSSDKTKKLNEDAVAMYMKFNEIGETEFKDAYRFNPDAIEEALEVIEKTYFSKK
jgi:hypothetical protein